MTSASPGKPEDSTSTESSLDLTWASSTLSALSQQNSEQEVRSADVSAAPTMNVKISPRNIEPEVLITGPNKWPSHTYVLQLCIAAPLCIAGDVSQLCDPLHCLPTNVLNAHSQMSLPPTPSV